MASLHAWRGGSLPEKREELYADTVNLLLDWWVSPKTVREADGTVKVPQPSIAEWLKVDMDKVRKLLNELAFKAHTSQPEVMGTADISEAHLISGLIKLSKNPEVKPVMLVEFLVDRAGILLLRGNGVYTFPHRTFQEYLAACYLTDSGFPEEIAGLVRKEPDRWREAALLAGAKAVRGGSFAIWVFVESLCYCDPGDVRKKSEDIWGAQIAAQFIAENADLKKISELNREKLTRVRKCIIEILSFSEFPARERAVAGDNLARIGDVRKEVMTIDEMPFCLVPKGQFLMGEENQIHENKTLSHDFWISKYPVTWSQFQQFVQDNGYKKESYWNEAKYYVWQDGKIIGKWDNTVREQPAQDGIPLPLSNHPVVGVCWYEALAFTRWLNEVWEEQGILPDGLDVKLPSEAEWEKAARGGLEIPVKPKILPIKDLSKDVPSAFETNPKPKRIYPWGNEPDSNCANYADTGIGTTSAVGCFPAGASPYGCEEMSGNVWEWTISLWGKSLGEPDYKYPYKTNDGRENLDASKDIARVLRGGAFYNDNRNVRSADRDRFNPDYWYSSIGFRIVLSPFNSKL